MSTLKFLLLLISCVCGKREHNRKSADLIILVGLPKSGTTAVHDTFLERGISSVHHHVEEHVHQLCPPDEFPIDGVTVGGNATGRTTYWHPVPAPMHHCYVGNIVQRALVNGLSPLEYMTEKGVVAFCQLDVCYPPSVCLFPQFEAIEEITTAYPDAHYIHTRRITVDVHVASLTAWKGGDFHQQEKETLVDRLRVGGYLSMFPTQSANQSEVDNLKHFVRDVSKQTVGFFEKRPHLKFLDVAIEDPNAGYKIGTFLGLYNFSLVKANQGGFYHDGLTASPTPSNFSTYLDAGGDDGEDDETAVGSTRSPARLATVPPPTDDDSPPAPVPKNQKDATKTATTTAAGGGKPENKGGVPGKSQAASTENQKGWIAAWLWPRPFDLPSALLGASAALLLAVMSVACLVCVTYLRRRGRGAMDVIRRDKSVKYSPLPLREDPNKDVDDDDDDGIGGLRHHAVELTRRSNRGVAEDDQDEEFGLDDNDTSGRRP